MTGSEAPKGIIFDLDGTLADTIADIAGAVNSVLASRGLPVHAPDAFKLMVGNGFSSLIGQVLPSGAASDPVVFRSVLAEAGEAYARSCLVETRPFPGIEDLLAGLDARGTVCAVLSNKPQELSARLVKALFPRAKFAAVFGERPGVPRKPDPQAALEIAAKAGLAPEEWAFVGDSGVDMRTARAAGMLAWGVLWGYRGAAELTEGGAEALYEHPAQLLAALG